MSLNFHYSLLKEGAAERFRVNTYNRTSPNRPTYDRYKVVSKISNILEDARENDVDLDNKSLSDEQFILAMSGEISKLNRTVDESFEFMRSAIVNVKDNIKAREKKTITVIENDPETFKKLDSCRVGIAIADIRPNQNTIESHDPCFDTLEEFFKDIHQFISSANKVEQLYGGTFDADYNAAAEYLESITKKAADVTHAIDNGPTRSIETYIFKPITAYGSNEPREVYINSELFFQAQKNVTYEYKNIVKEIEDLEANCVAAKSKILKSISDFTDDLNNTIIDKTDSHEAKINIYSSALKILKKYNVELSKILSLYVSAITTKMNRLYRIFGVGCDSDKVYDRCLQILGKADYLQDNEIVLGAENESHTEIMDHWVSAIARLNEAEIEFNQTENMYIFLNEADGDNAGKGIIAWIKGFIDKCIQAVKKFFGAITNKANDNKWWADNKAAFSRVNLRNVTVRDYYEYDLQKILQDPKINDTDPAAIAEVESVINSGGFKDQAAIDNEVTKLKNGYEQRVKDAQKSYLSALNASGVQINENDSFTNQVLAVYRGKYTAADAPVTNIQKDADEVINFIDQFQGGLTKSIQKQVDALKNYGDRVVQKADALLNAMQNKGNTSVQQTEQQQDQSASTESAEFSLAECFNIADRRVASFLEVQDLNPGQQDAIVTQNRVNYAQLKAELSRYIRMAVQIPGEALGARQQAAINAYGQYTAIAKMILNGSQKQREPVQQNNNQQQTTTQQTTTTTATAAAQK